MKKQLASINFGKISLSLRLGCTVGETKKERQCKKGRKVFRETTGTLSAGPNQTDVKHNKCSISNENIVIETS